MLLGGGARLPGCISVRDCPVGIEMKQSLHRQRFTVTVSRGRAVLRSRSSSYQCRRKQVSQFITGWSNSDTYHQRQSIQGALPGFAHCCGNRHTSTIPGAAPHDEFIVLLNNTCNCSVRMVIYKYDGIGALQCLEHIHSDSGMLYGVGFNCNNAIGGAVAVIAIIATTCYDCCEWGRYECHFAASSHYQINQYATMPGSVPEQREYQLCAAHLSAALCSALYSSAHKRILTVLARAVNGARKPCRSISTADIPQQCCIVIHLQRMVVELMTDVLLTIVRCSVRQPVLPFAQR
jgi:hypothetical protein